VCNTPKELAPRGQAIMAIVLVPMSIPIVIVISPVVLPFPAKYSGPVDAYVANL